MIWFLLWCFLVTESPAKHPSISNKELEYIQGNIGYTDEQTQVGNNGKVYIYREA